MDTISKDALAFISKLASLSIDVRKKVNLSKDILVLLNNVLNSGYLSENFPDLIDEDQKIDISYFNIVAQDLKGFDFSNFKLKYCTFNKSIMDEISASSIVNRAIDEEISLKKVDFSNSNYAKRNVNSTALGMSVYLPFNFNGIELQYSNFSRSDLSGAIFDGANLEGCDFSFTILEGATFKNTNIKGTNFLSSTILPEQLVDSFNFSLANFDNEKFKDDVENLKSSGKNKKNQNIIFEFINSLKNKKDINTKKFANNLSHSSQNEMLQTSPDVIEQGKIQEKINNNSENTNKKISFAEKIKNGLNKIKTLGRE